MESKKHEVIEYGFPPERVNVRLKVFEGEQRKAAIDRFNKTKTKEKNVTAFFPEERMSVIVRIAEGETMREAIDRFCDRREIFVNPMKKRT